jgi:small subunit ribosomal protein S2
LAQLSKKEAARLNKSRAKLETTFSGIKDMGRLPGLVFIVDTKKEHIAVREANRLGVPSIGIVDTNADPDEVTYPIPGNDDAIRAIQLYARFVSDAVLEARASAPPAPEPATEPAAADTHRTIRPDAGGRGVWSSDYKPPGKG